MKKIILWLVIIGMALAIIGGATNRGKNEASAYEFTDEDIVAIWFAGGKPRSGL